MNKKTATITRENKSFPLQIKEFDDAQGRIKGYLSTFDNVDEGGDRVRSGAFKRTLANKYAYKQKHDKRYVMPFLWQHDTNEPVGGFLELKEDQIGLFFDLEIDLDTQRGRECYSGYKKGYIYQTSMGYDCLQSEYVKVDDGNLVRDLIEVRLWEGSAVTFPMNEQAIITDVKSLNGEVVEEREDQPEEGMEAKTACGSTSGPIGPRDESWDGAAAKKWIWSKAMGEDGKVKASVAKKYFMRCDGDPEQKTSYGYPFWTNNHISVGGVKAVANALAGARNADAGGDTAGMQRKVERLYGRINSKYPDAEKLVPPWKSDDDKEDGQAHEHKSLIEHYNDEMAADLLVDWQDIYVCSLTCAMLDALKEGGDVGEVLDDFKTLVMEKFMPQVEDVDLASYLEDHSSSYNSADHMMQYGSESKPMYGGYMSSQTARSHKAGRAISATNMQHIRDHMDSLKAMAKQHMKDIHSATDNLASVLQGEAPTNGTDEDTTSDGQQEGKSATSRGPARGTQERSSQEDTVNEDEISAFLHQLQSLKVPQ